MPLIPAFSARILRPSSGGSKGPKKLGIRLGNARYYLVPTPGRGIRVNKPPPMLRPAGGETKGLVGIRLSETSGYQVLNAENAFDSGAASADLGPARARFKMGLHTGDLSLRKMQCSHRLRQPGSLNGFSREWRSLMMQGVSTEPEGARALGHCLDHISAFFIFAEAIDNDRGSIGKDCLYSKFSPYRVDVISQSAQIHVCALFYA